MNRRYFMKSVICSSALGLYTGIESFSMIQQVSANTDKNAFNATSKAEVVEILFGQKQISPGNKIQLHTPILVSHGQPALAEVSCELADVKIIALLTENNRYPLNTFIKLQGAEAFYSTRIRVEETSAVHAYVLANGQLYTTSKIIKVNSSGYGTHLSQLKTQDGGLV